MRDKDNPAIKSLCPNGYDLCGPLLADAEDFLSSSFVHYLGYFLCELA